MNDEDPPITNIKDGLNLSLNGTSDQFLLPKVLSLPIEELTQVADFLYSHVQERPVSCQINENEVFLSSGKENLKLKFHR